MKRSELRLYRYVGVLLLVVLFALTFWALAGQLWFFLYRWNNGLLVGIAIVGGLMYFATLVAHFINVTITHVFNARHRRRRLA